MVNFGFWISHAITNLYNMKYTEDEAELDHYYDRGPRIFPAGKDKINVVTPAPCLYNLLWDIQTRQVKCLL